MAFGSEIDEFFKDDAERAEFFGDLQDTPNGKFFAARMTLLNKLSDHKDGPRMVLDPAGANLKSLVGKPIHFTPNFDMHKEAGAEGEPETIRTFGVSLGGRVHPAKTDGSVPLDVFGLLWKDDHPKAVEQVEEHKADMGMSWEIQAPHGSLRKTIVEGQQPILYVKDYSFGGTAVLRHEHAAYPDSHLIVANAKGREVQIDLSKVADLESNVSPKVSPPLKPAAGAGTVPPVAPPKERRDMSKFCASCETIFADRLQKGEIVHQAEIESREEFRKLEASRDAATKERDETKEALKIAEKERADLQAEKDRDIRVATAQKSALGDWENEKTAFDQKSETRDAFLAAKATIYLQESAEKVTEAFNTLMKLKADNGSTGAPAGGTSPGDRRPMPFDAFAGVGVVQDMTEEDRAKKSRTYLAQRYGEKEIRRMVHGEGIALPGANSGPGGGYKEGG